MRRAVRIDQNQQDIVKALRQAGSSVLSLAAIGNGCPDLLVGWHGRNYLLEVKYDKGDLSAEQVIWHKDWRGQVATVRTVTEAIETLNTLTRRG